MSQNLQRDWDKFQKITHDYYEHVMVFAPNHVRGKWVIGCYRSLKSFKSRFPSSEAREKIIADLKARDNVINKELKELQAKYERDKKSQAG